MKKFRWVVVFEVDEAWVTDGFDLTNARAEKMIQNELPYSYVGETSAEVLGAPEASEIRKAQGYKS